MESLLALLIKASLPAITALGSLLAYKINKLISMKTKHETVDHLLRQLEQACSKAVRSTAQTLELNTARNNGKLSFELQAKARDHAFKAVEQILGNEIFKFMKILGLDYVQLHNLIIHNIEAEVANMKMFL